MARAFNVIVERDSEGYYVASVPELRGCHTQARSLDVLMKRIQEAIELCLEDERRKTGPVSETGPVCGPVWQGTFDWRGSLRDKRDQFTSTDLQHQALAWWEVKRK